MKCPHCLVEFHDKKDWYDLESDKNGRWTLERRTCPSCMKFIFNLTNQQPRIHVGQNNVKTYLVYPKTISRSPLPEDVPEKYASDYREACITLADSPKASAALSRRCLQHLLREESKVKHQSLASEIQEVIDKQLLPGYLLESIDAVRNIGNFAAHPMKASSTGEIIDVEPGEAEWNLEVIESLFNFYFVQPAQLKRKKDALNEKLKTVGKPEMKGA